MDARYPFQGAAPIETAKFTSAGPLAVGSRVRDPKRPVMGVSFQHASWQEGPRHNDLDSQSGIRNYFQVCSAVQSHFSETTLKILEGKKPLGIGGDHSMAAGCVPGAVLGITIRELLRRKDDPLRDPNLNLTGPAQDQESALARLRVARDDFLEKRDRDHLKKLGVCFDRLIYTKLLPLSQYMRFKNRFHILWFDAHYDANTPFDADSSFRKSEENVRPFFQYHQLSELFN